MEDTELYAMLLGIKFSWRVNEVQVDIALNRIDVWVEEAPGTKFSCAVCKQETSVYDHTEEQIWRHLDTCQCQTFVHARLTGFALVGKTLSRLKGLSGSGIGCPTVFRAGHKSARSREADTP